MNGHQWRNLLRLDLDGLAVELIQHPDFMPSAGKDFRGQTLHTTDLVIRNLPAAEFQRAQDLARDVAELLSLATSSEVVAFGYEFPDIVPSQQLRSFVGKTQFFRPALPIHFDAWVTKSFLEQTLGTYRRLRGPRRLEVAVDYYVHSQRSGQAVELELITTFVLLENLKTTFAHQQGYPFIKGYFRNFGSTAANPGKKLSFQVLLTTMFAAVAMNPSLQAIIDLRNELIHSGLTTLDFHGKWQMLEQCQDIIREYLLRLLNFTGHFSTFSMKRAQIV